MSTIPEPGQAQVVLYADAQAQIEALQAQNAEWERKCRDLCLAHGPLLIEHHDVKRDLTQLQALVRAISETMEPFRKSLAKLDEVDTLATRRIAEADAYYCAQRVLATLDATTPATHEQAKATVFNEWDGALRKMADVEPKGGDGD